MAADVMIRAEGLGKRYVIGHQAERERYVALRDVLARNARNLARSARDLFTGRPNVGGDEVEEFWALKDVGFEIRRGDVVGVVGRNGAGKSTLLKILSRITEPSTGKVEIRGRVASLLEVGTGFHPELTGRENIFLNGAILGMTRAEIRRKFDEIVDFAGVERFLDTPVKRYSSGMYVRLAFAVAAHLEPEILVIDEVLAVGDAEFQKKCLGKLSNIANSGRTVLFVSHNAQAISAICERCLWLDNKRVAMDGTPTEVLRAYGRPSGDHQVSEVIAALPADELFRLHDVRLSQHGAPAERRIVAGAPLTITIDYEVLKPAFGLRVLFQLCDELENALIQGFHDENESTLETVQPGRYVSTAEIPADLLAPIDYAIRVQAGIHHGRPVMPLDAVIFRFEVDRPYRGPAEYSGLAYPAKLAPRIAWRTEATGA